MKKTILILAVFLAIGVPSLLAAFTEPIKTAEGNATLAYLAYSNTPLQEYLKVNDSIPVYAKQTNEDGVKSESQEQIDSVKVSMAALFEYGAPSRFDLRRMAELGKLSGEEYFVKEITGKKPVGSGKIARKAGRLGLGIVMVKTGEGETLKAFSAAGDKLTEGDSVTLWSDDRSLLDVKYVATRVSATNTVPTMVAKN